MSSVSVIYHLQHESCIIFNSKEEFSEDIYIFFNRKFFELFLYLINQKTCPIPFASFFLGK